MARGRRREIPPCSKTYGFPIYCAAWVPFDRIAASAAAAASAPADEGTSEKEEKDKKDEKEKEGEGGIPSSASPVRDPNRILVALGGGGGEGRSGIPNVLLIADFDLASRILSDQPVFRLGTDDDVPYRMSVHPGADGVVCSFPKSCRLFDWEISESRESNVLALRSSAKKLTALEDIGLQLALAFNAEGSILATGGEDGHLRVFKWPSMENILDQADAHATVKDLDFSPNGKFLVSLGNSGPCRVWDLTSSTAVASLPRENVKLFLNRFFYCRHFLNYIYLQGEIFGFCRFCPTTADNQLLYITAMHGDQAKIVSWGSLSWKRVGTKRISRDPISAFNVSKDGEHLAVGTVEGDVTIFRRSDMRAQIKVRKAHLGIVTAVVFSQDSRALVSASFDSNARVTLLESKRNSGGFNMWLVLLLILLAAAVYYMRLKGVLGLEGYLP